MGHKVEGVSFNTEWLESFSTEAEFLAAMQDEGQAHVFEGEGRDEKLKAVWALLHPPVTAVVEETKSSVEDVPEVTAESDSEAQDPKRKKKVGNTTQVGLAGGTEG